MAKLSDASMRKIASCDSKLQLIVTETIKIIDFKVIYGHRSNEEQEQLFKIGTTKKRGGDSKHNKFPSEAVDLAPYPIDFSNTELARARFYYLAGMVTAIATRLGIRLRWGGDWDGDVDFSDQSFHDLGHFELEDD